MAAVYKIWLVAAAKYRPERHYPLDAVFHFQRHIFMGRTDAAVQRGRRGLYHFLNFAVCVPTDTETVLGLAQHIILKAEHYVIYSFKVASRVLQHSAVFVNELSVFLFHTFLRMYCQ